MTATRFSAKILLALALLAGSRAVGAQQIVLLGGDVDERLRLAELLGPSAANQLIRSPSRLGRAIDTAHTTSFALGMLEARTMRNSALPFSMNDGPLWAGRGWNASVTPAVTSRFGPVRLAIAPTLISSQNTAFQAIPFPQGVTNPRSEWANPFHPLPESIDLPLRFGDRSRATVDAGQSSFVVTEGGASFGFANENLWWGPGIQNALTISNNAAGFPHLFLETTRPLHTRAGTFDAQWILGQLTESAYFDFDPSNDKRSLNGVVMTWATPFDSTLTFGLSRIVMGARTSGAFPAGAAFDVLRSVGHLNVNGDSVPKNARDQITSVFARWLFPAAGFEAYAEWARFEEPLSVRDFLEFPGHSEGYTLGFQWAHPLQQRRAFRLQGEATYVEPDPSLRLRPTAVTYTSRGVPQGFTQRGQMLGAAIGPGASSQWLAGEVFAPHWRVGPYLSRIRWDEGTMEEAIVPFFKRQDVTMLAGIRAGWTWRDLDVLASFAHAARFNYLFQAYPVGNQQRTVGVDLLNNTLSVTLSTPLRAP